MLRKQFSRTTSEAIDQSPIIGVRAGVRSRHRFTGGAREARGYVAIERPYAEKYPTPASQKYVRGFRSARRRRATIEFLPR